MKNTFLNLISIILVAAACTRPSPEQVKNDIDTSLKENEKAQTSFEWEASEYHSEQIFSNWKDNEANPEDVCKELLAKSPKELSSFEEEIQSKEFSELLKPCQKELMQKLEEYWKEEKSKITVLEAGSELQPKATFKFPDNVQTRDFSQGYKAISGDVKNKEVILTFDDGPHPQYTDRILKALEAVNAKVIFFSTGNSAKANPQVLKRMGSAGHSIGSHSMSHKCLAAKKVCDKSNRRKLSYKEVISEIMGGHEIIFDILGWVDPVFRFPYGESSPELKQFLAERGVGEFYWSIDSEDWKTRTPAELISFTMKQVDYRQKGILLFHDVQRKTAEALPALLKQLYFKGYSIVLLKSANPNDRLTSRLVTKKPATIADAPLN